MKLSELDFPRALEGVEYPAARAELLNRSRDHGGVNGNVQVILERIPDRPYGDLAAVMREAEIVLQNSPDLHVGEPAAQPKPRPDDMAAVTGGEAAEPAAEKILERNRAIVEGREEPAAAPPIPGAGRSVGTDPSRTGDYSSD
jgi:hypothetical protein